LPKILLIADVPRDTANTIEEHVQGIVRNSKFNIYLHRSRDKFPGNLKDFDAIILHYTLIAYPFRNDNMVSSELRYQLVHSNIPKFAIVQDDYRAIFERIRFFNFIGIKHVFTLGNLKVREKIYPSNLCNFTTSQILTGYNDGSYMSWPNIEWESRTIDIGYRARSLPRWMGELGTYKSEIVELVRKNETISNLTLDVNCSESSRLYGADWIHFLCNVRIALGTESGSSTLDFDGRYSDYWTYSHGKSINGTAEPLNIDYGVISPRIFEYTAARCLMGLTDGHYSGVVQPWEHYFPLRKDLANFRELIEFSKDETARTEMINRAYKHLVLSGNYSYSALALTIDERIMEFINISQDNRFSTRADIETKEVVETINSKGKENTLKSQLVYMAKFIDRKILPAILRGFLRRTLFLAYFNIKPKLKSLFFFGNIKEIHNACKAAKLKISIRNKLRLSIDLDLLLDFISEANKNDIELMQRFQTGLHFLEWDRGDLVDDRLVDFPKLTISSFQGAEGFYISKGLYSLGSPPTRLPRFSGFRFTHEADFQKLLDQILKI